MIEAVGMIRHRYRFATNQSSLHKVRLTAPITAHAPAFSATLLDDGNDRNAYSCRFR
jgi:hypothetical protein